MTEQFKRNIAFKLKIGSILAGKPIIENERLRHIEIKDKQVIRVNVIANIVEKYVQEGEKKYAVLTLDDATGQIRVKSFGEEAERLVSFNQGDTIVVIGMLRTWSNEIYITPEIIKKVEPSYLLLRKLEIEAEEPKITNPNEITALKEKIIRLIKESEKDGGVDTEKIILELHESPELINQEIKKLLEEGIIYEPRPARLRWLG